MPSPPEATSRRARRAVTSRRARRPARPAVDERLVMPETRYEIIEGQVVYVPPADEPHGTAHAKLLEELAFEVVSTESLSHAAKKARALVQRGVRRVFAIDVKGRQLLEWSKLGGTWEALPLENSLLDSTLGAPLPAKVLVDTARAGDAIAAALLAKKNPVIESAVREGEQRGEARGRELGRALGALEGKMAALLAILNARKLRASPEQEQRMRAAAGEAQLDRWLAAALDVSSVDDLLRRA